MLTFSRLTIKKLFIGFAIFIVLMVLLVVLATAWVDRQHRREVYQELETVAVEQSDSQQSALSREQTTEIEDRSIDDSLADSTENLQVKSQTEPVVPFKVSVVFSDDYLINLGGAERAHPFDIKKYKKIHDALLADKLLTSEATLKPEPIPVEDLLLVHSRDYLKSLADRDKLAGYLESPILRVLPVSLNKGILMPFRSASGGTLLAARSALEHGIGINIGGGYHHAKPKVGEGFCVYADVPVAIRRLQKEKKIERAIVIDVDVHQGNGTIVCLKDDDSTFTFSMHQAGIYPIPKEQGDRDVELTAGMEDKEYLEILNRHLATILDESKPDICFVVAGCDTLAGDPLASLAMTEDGIVQRDAAIFAACSKRKIPVVFTTSGGYSKNAWHAQYESIKKLIETYGLAENKKSQLPEEQAAGKK